MILNQTVTRMLRMMIRKVGFGFRVRIRVRVRVRVRVMVRVPGGDVSMFWVNAFSMFEFAPFHWQTADVDRK